MNYNKGDIIYSNGDTFVATGLVDPAGNQFNQIDFGWIKQNTVSELINATIYHTEEPSDVSRASGGQLVERPYVSSTVKFTGLISKDEFHPVIGKVSDGDCSYPLWNIAAIQVHYPEVYNNIIRQEFDRIFTV